MSKSTSQAEHLKDMLVGNIIAVSWPEVIQDRRCSTARSGVFHYIFRKPFLAISMQHDQSRSDRSERALLGLPVLRLLRPRRHLVGRDRRRAAGVLLPDRSGGGGDALRRFDRPPAGDWLDHGDGRVGAGVYLSLVLDLPTGATIVCTFGLVLVLMALARPFIRRRRRSARPRPDRIPGNALQALRHRDCRQSDHLFPLRRRDHRSGPAGGPDQAAPQSACSDSWSSPSCCCWRCTWGRRRGRPPILTLTRPSPDCSPGRRS